MGNSFRLDSDRLFRGFTSGKLQLIGPGLGIVRQDDLDLDQHVAVAARVKASHVGQTAPVLYRRNQAALRSGNVTKKPQSVQKIRLARSIRAHDEDPRTNFQVDRSKILPV